MPLYPDEESNVSLLFAADADIVELGVAISAAKVLGLSVIPFEVRRFRPTDWSFPLVPYFTITAL